MLLEPLTMHSLVSIEERKRMEKRKDKESVGELLVTLFGMLHREKRHFSSLILIYQGKVKLLFRSLNKYVNHEYYDNKVKQWDFSLRFICF